MHWKYKLTEEKKNQPTKNHKKRTTGNHSERTIFCRFESQPNLIYLLSNYMSVKLSPEVV